MQIDEMEGDSLKQIKSIWIVTSGYPTKEDPHYAFIRPVVCEMADMGIECTVFVPQSITRYLLEKKKTRPKEWFDYTENNSKIRIIQPVYLSLSTFKLFGKELSITLKTKCLKKAFEREKERPDVIYTHFWDNGIIAASIVKDKPIYVATGESNIWVKKKFQWNVIEKALNNITGVIGVSTKNIAESKRLGLLDKVKKTIVLPNGYNPKQFYSYSKDKAREELAIPNDSIVAIFVGAFCERKGDQRVVEAAKKVDDLKLIMVGKGENKPSSDQIIFCGPVSHGELVKYLNAADVFVLPTLAEGCCNAIVEAIACGLPIISSNRDFNDDILDNSYSIRINPDSVDEISNALKTIVDNPEYRREMARKSKERALSLTIQSRVEKIVDFMSM